MNLALQGASYDIEVRCGAHSLLMNNLLVPELNQYQAAPVNSISQAAPVALHMGADLANTEVPPPPVPSPCKKAPTWCTADLQKHTVRLMGIRQL